VSIIDLKGHWAVPFEEYENTHKTIYDSIKTNNYHVEVNYTTNKDIANVEMVEIINGDYKH